ncbi:MAG: guanylate kinase [Clostridia bacterium]|nr:guanylate kinase [Clostridia bacterium]
MAKNKGLVVVLSGPAGSGKDTILERYFQTGMGKKTISATTRAIRPGETDGVDYYFMTRQQFEEAIRNDMLLEYTSYAGNYYGTLKSEINNIIADGHDAVLKIEVTGGRNVRRLFPDAVLVFLMPPSVEILVERLTARGTEDADALRRRLRTAAEEVSVGCEQYDYLIVNDTVEQAAIELDEIIRAEKLRVSRNAEFFEEVKNDVKTLIL